MIEFQNLISILTAIGVIATASATAGIWYYTKQDRRTIFGKFQRKKENGIQFIYVGSPSKPIRICKATFKGEPLLIRGTTNYEKGVDVGEGCNFDMPLNVSEDDDGFVIIRDGKKMLIKEKFNKLEQA